MKTTTLLLVLMLTGSGLRAQVPATPVLPRPALPRPTLPGAVPGQPGQPGQPGANPNAGMVSGALNNGGNFSNLNFDQSSRDESPTNTINFQGVDVAQVLEIYAGLVRRTLIHGPLPQASIVFKTEQPLTRSG